MHELEPFYNWQHLYIASEDEESPFYGTEYTFNHLGLESKLKNNITMKYYEAGHMMYISNTAAAAFKKDVAAFILGAIK